MKYNIIKPIADLIVEKLSPICQRIQIAGSIRRKRPECKDIEIVCLPNFHKTGLFNDIIERTNEFIKCVRGLGEIIKGDPRYGRYLQIKLESNIKLDLFIANQNNWGLILAIRTGSAEYSHRILATSWVRAGYESVGGSLYKRGTDKRIPVREEKDLYNLIGVQWVEPENREL